MRIATSIAILYLALPISAQDKKDALDKVTTAQRLVVVKAIREKVREKFKDTFSNEERDGFVAKAKENPAQYLESITDPNRSKTGKGKYGTFLGRDFTVRNVISDSQLLVTWREKTTPLGGDSYATVEHAYIVDYPSEGLKVGTITKLGWKKPDKGEAPKPAELFYATGQKTIDKKQAWRIVKFEFTETELKQLDPRVELK